MSNEAKDLTSADSEAVKEKVPQESTKDMLSDQEEPTGVEQDENNLSKVCLPRND